MVLLSYSLALAGYPCCCERCARNYYALVFDVGPLRELVIKLSLS